MELVEREELLAHLDELLDDARAGSGRIVFVGGEAGAGKTSLIRAFCAGLTGDVRVLWGACDPLATPRPFGPFHDMASGHPSVAAALEQPGVHERHVALLDELALTTTMVVEDAHWSDEATLDALRFLGRRIDGTRALVLVTHRDDELDADHVLRGLLGDLATSPGLRRIEVPLLSPGGVAMLVGDVGVDAQRLYEATDGNPFFVTETLAVPTATVPATVSDAVLSRARRLTVTARGVLDVVSLAPGGLEPSLATTLAPDDPEAAIDECADHGLLLADGARLTFRHELARLAVERSIPGARRQRLHRQLLEVLEALPGPDPARLVHHAELAADAERVLRYAPLAAREAARRGAHREAAAHYGRAVTHVGGLPSTERAELLECWADEREAFDERQEVARVREEAIAIYRRIGDSQREAMALAALGRLLENAGHLSEGAKRLMEAVEILERLPPGPDLAWVYALVAFGEMNSYRLREAITWGTRATDLAEEHRATKAMIKATAAIGLAESWSGLARESIETLERSSRLAVQAGDDALTAASLHHLGSACLQLRQYEQALPFAREALSFASERDLDTRRMYVRLTLAQCFFEQGRWAEATSVVDGITGDTLADLIRLRIETRTGRLAAFASTDDLWPVVVDSDYPGDVFVVAVGRAEAAWLTGRPDEIPGIVGRLYERMLGSGAVREIGELAFWLWRAGALEEPPELPDDPYVMQIAGDWRGAAEAWERIGCPYEQAEALADGDEPAMREALEIFMRIGGLPAADRVRARMREAGVKHVPSRPRAATRAAPAGLTRRQLEVLRLLDDGRTNADIARELFITEKTAEHHVAAILSKLGAHSRREASVAARKIGAVNQQP